MLFMTAVGSSATRCARGAKRWACTGHWASNHNHESQEGCGGRVVRRDPMVMRRYMRLSTNDERIFRRAQSPMLRSRSARVSWMARANYHGRDSGRYGKKRGIRQPYSRAQLPRVQVLDALLTKPGQVFSFPRPGARSDRRCLVDRRDMIT